MKTNKIGIDISSLKDGNQFRGVGFYTKNLVDALQRLVKEDKKYLNWQINLIENCKPASPAGGLKIENFNVIHYPYFDPFFLTLPKCGEVPMVVTVHDLTPLKFPEHYPPGIKGKLRWFAQKNRLKKVDAIITDSQNSKKDIIEIAGYPKNKIHVIYLAPAPNFKKLEIGNWKLEIKQKYHLPDTFVLYVGDVNWNKNIPGLVKACEKVGIPLVIVGKQAVSKNYDRTHVENRDLVWLQNYFENCKLKIENSRFLNLVGFVSTKDLVAIYNLATVYCQPSFYEGFGLPVLEAMACGCPVISSNRGSLPEICGKAALMFNPQKKGDIGNALQKIIKSKKTAADLSKRGLIQAKKFSWQKTARETLNIYNKLCQN